MSPLLKGITMNNTSNGVAQALDEEILRALSDMQNYTVESDEYTTLVARLEVLTRARSNLKDRTVSPDSLIAAVGNLAGILSILHFEKFGVVTSKALNFVTKSRL